MPTHDHTTDPETDPRVLEEMDEIIAPENDTPVGGHGATTDETDEIQDLKNALLRTQADYQNLLMRVERDRADMVHFLSAKILLPLLTQVDNLERAVKLKEGVQDDAFVAGIRSMLSGFQRYLESQGVTPYDSIGQEVDPDRHEVMTEMAGASGKIIQEFERGYTLRDRVLRHAKVVVGNGD